MLLTAVLLAVGGLLPASYVVRGPGPTFDTLGAAEQDGDEPLITITGAETYPTTGQLRFTTVSGLGTPDNRPALGQLVFAWLDPDEAVYPIEEVYPPGQTQQQVEEENRIQMVSSQEVATYAALTELGYDVPTTVVIVEVPEDSGASGVLEADDVVLALDGQPVAGYDPLISALAHVEPGATVQLRVRRDGAEVTVPVVTGTGEDGTAILGVMVAAGFDLPIEVSIHSGDVGGASAGTMFALAIIDLLTPEDEAAGQVIAGTGTMSTSGEVGAIGGITFKMRGAVRDGARWFLAPQANCAEVVGNVPAGLRVVAVETLEQARDAVVAIGAGEAQDLPTCS